MPDRSTGSGAIARVGIVMGSDSDWPVMSAAATALAEFEVPYAADVVSAHRMPDAMIDYGRFAARRGLAVIIAGAGGAAHLPGMLAAVTPLPVIGVPVPLKYLDGMDSLLSIVQMPAGVPVATVAIGNARNAEDQPGQPRCQQPRDRRAGRRQGCRLGCRRSAGRGAGVPEQADLGQHR